MRALCLLSVLVIRCAGYELIGQIDPAASVVVSLNGATTPFEASTVSDPGGNFRFRKLAAGAYTLAISTAAHGELQKTVEVGHGTVDSKGRLKVLLRIDESRLESDGGHAAGATVSAVFLSIRDGARREFAEAQRCLSRGDSNCATGHLQRAVTIAPQFAGAWNQLGTIAYQSQRYGDAETNFRRALDADPEAFEPLVNLGGVLLNLGLPGWALEYNQRAVARRSNNALANSQLGLSYFMLNDPDRAERYLKIAVQIDPAHFSHPQLVLAQIYMKRGNRPSALASLRGFLKEHPDAREADWVRRELAELSGK